jgi:hypothetical protein
MTTTRVLVGVLGIAAAAVAAGCDEVGTQRQPLSVGASVVEQKPAAATPDGGDTDAAAPAQAVTSPVGAPVPIPGSYEAMCRHYCETLEKTLVYACLVQGRDDDCTTRFLGTTARCIDLRCAPRLVEPSLCLVQCDALEANESSYCETAPVPDPVCATPPATRNEVCHAGCSVDSP